MTVAQKLAQRLKEIGVTHVFGIPGGPSIPYMDACRKLDLRVITVANEQSAGIMADMFGLFHGVPGVCFATFGPGATNLSSGVGTAFLDRSPVLAFSSELPVADQGRKIQMNVDHQAIFAPVTKYTTRLDGARFNEEFEKSLQLSLVEMPGPVHIGLPIDIYAEEVVEGGAQQDAVQQVHTSLRTEALQVLLQAKKPLLVLGLSAARLLPAEAVQAFVRKNHFAVVVTPMAKELISMDDEKYSGVLFHACSDYVANVYRQADAVLALGYDSVEFNYESWMPHVPLVHIDSEKLDISPDYHAVYEVVGDLRSSFEQLSGVQFPATDWDFAQIEKNRQAMFQAIYAPQKGFSPAEALRVIREEVADDTILTLDVGAHTHLFGQAWDVKKGRFVMTNGWSTMGFAIPAGIGAKLANPETTVISVVGDGSFLMNCGELLVALRENVAFTTIVFVDGDYSLIKVKQSWKDVPHYQTKVIASPYFKADAFLGVPVYHAANAAELQGALQHTTRLTQPAIIEVMVDGALYEDIIVKQHK